jgi:nitrite reductase/ring-hydroxylating ferredoxin subunit
MKFTSAFRLKQLQENVPALIKHGKHGKTRLACVRSKGEVHVFEDACPHEGRPLSMGSVRNGMLVCPWHNWKFDLTSGACTFGGESARRLETEIHEGEVFIREGSGEVSSGEQERISRDLSAAVFEGRVDGFVREGLRLEQISETSMFETVLSLVIERAPYGLGDSAAALVSARALVQADVLSQSEALLLIGRSLVPSLVGKAAQALPPHALVDTSQEAFLEDLLEEQRERVVLRAIAHQGSYHDFARDYALPLLSIKLLDGGMSLVRTMAALRLTDAATDETALKAAVAKMLSWSVARSDLPNWKITRGAVSESLRVPYTEIGAALDHDYGALLLKSERRAVTATMNALRSGVSIALIFDAITGAAKRRLETYDHTWSDRAGSNVTSAEPVTALMFVQAAAKATALGANPRSARGLAILAAGLIGRLGRLCSDRAPQKTSASHTAKDSLQRVLFDSALASHAPALALMFVSAMKNEAEPSAMLATVLLEPRAERRAAANAERIVQKRKAHDGID